MSVCNQGTLIHGSISRPCVEFNMPDTQTNFQFPKNLRGIKSSLYPHFSLFPSATSQHKPRYQIFEYSKFRQSDKPIKIHIHIILYIMRITAITITLLTVLASTTGATPIPPPSSTSNTELQPRQLGNTFQDQGFKPVPPQSGGKVVKPWDPPEGKCIGWGGVHLLGCVEKIKRSLSLPTPWNPPEGKCVGW